MGKWLKHILGATGFLVAVYGADRATHGDVVAGLPLFLVGLCLFGGLYWGALGVGLGLAFAGLCLIFYGQWWPGLFLIIGGFVIARHEPDAYDGLPIDFGTVSSHHHCDSSDASCGGGDGGGGD